MRFDIFGPFQLIGDGVCRLAANQDDFWEEVEVQSEGLGAAKGCYVFGIGTSGSNKIKPWYVGKTHRSFYVECITPSKWKHYSVALSKYQRAKPYLFFLPVITETGKFAKGNERSIDFLEKYLIGLGIRVNKELCNIKDAQIYRDIEVPGIINRSTDNLKDRVALRKAFEL